MSFAPQRPTGVVVVAILEVIFGIFSISEGALLNTSPKILGVANSAKLSSDVGPFGAIILVLGLFAPVISYGILTRKRWAWTYAIMISALGILTNITAFFFGSKISAFGVALALLVIYYLTRSNVKEFFPKLYPTTAPSK